MKHSAFFVLPIMLVFALSTQAGVVVDLFPESGDGYMVYGHNVSLHGLSAKVKINVYATLTGTDSSKDEWLQTLYCNFQASVVEAGIVGSFSLGSYASPYNQNTATPSVTSNLIGNLTSTTGDWIARASEMHIVTDTSALLGYFYYNVTDITTDGPYMTEIHYVKAVKNISAATFAFDSPDGVANKYTGSTGYDMITVGQAVWIGYIPEPSTFALLGLSGLAAFFFVRRKNRKA